jgi:hypothetical protein
MGTVITLKSQIFSGDVANITFYPLSGGSIDLGSHIIPYTFDVDNYEGTYDLYFIGQGQNCQLIIPETTTTTTEPPTFNYFTVAKSCEVCDPQLCENFLNNSTGGYYFNFVTYQEITPPILLTIDGCCMYVDSVLNQNLPGYSTFIVTENQYQIVSGTISEECPKCL